MKRAIGFSLLMLSACVAPQKVAPPPVPQPTPTPTPPSSPPPPADWRDRPYTPGDWVYARNGALSEARYGEAGALPRLALTCDRAAQQIRLTWPGAPAGRVTIRTTSGDAWRQGAESQAGLQLALAASDPLLDQMAFSRGRFLLSSGGQELIVPSWPEVARVIEDCR